MNWQAETLWQTLEPLLPGLTVEIAASCPSTNSVLLERARGGSDAPAEDQAPAFAQVRRSRESAAFGRRPADSQPCLLVAEHQTQGRGRMGRSWASAAGASLTFSLSLPMAPADWSGLSLAVGVALAEALDPADAGDSPRIGIKWPNDLWLLDSLPGEALRGRKLGGILIETCAAGEHRMAVIGVGLNIALPPVDDAAALSQGAASLQELQPELSAPVALAQLAEPLLRALTQFQREGFAAFADRYARRDLLHGQSVVALRGELVEEGLAQGVSAQGALQLQTAIGLQSIASGEVSVRLAPAGVQSAC